MTRSEIYREAALLVDARGDQPACLAIDDAQGRACDASFSQAALAYQRLFEPDYAIRACWGLQWDDNPEQVKRCRILSLLFMAAIAEERSARRSGRSPKRKTAK